MIETSLAYDDVLLKPRYSKVVPSEVQTKGFFSRSIALETPIVSAAMDTVTESSMAIAMAQLGGLGVIHKNMPIAVQAEEVQRVKRKEFGMVSDPVTVGPDMTMAEVADIFYGKNVTGAPVIDDQKRLVGILTNRDIPTHKDIRSQKVSSLMTKDVISVEEGTLPDQAMEMMFQYRIEKLPVLSTGKELVGMFTRKDLENARVYPKATRDPNGQLRCAAAIGALDFDRLAALVAKGIDAVVIDTAHGHTMNVEKTILEIKAQYPDRGFDLVVGNIATKEAAEFLGNLPLEGIKVGIGPGSICTTRVVAGIGIPQFSAVMEAAQVLQKKDIPFVADGGIQYSGDLAKALAVGAGSVMLGSLLAGTDESPGEIILYEGRSYKIYRGMGSLDAMLKGSKDRYNQGSVGEASKLVPEGIEGRIPYRGRIQDMIYQLLGGLKSSMGYLGAKDLKAFQENAEFLRISPAGLKESHPHHVQVTKEAPNYSHF